MTPLVLLKQESRRANGAIGRRGEGPNWAIILGENPYQRPYSESYRGEISPKYLICMVGGTGIEPVTPAV